MLSKLLKVSVLTLLAYLLQATTAEYLSIWDIAPSLALAIIAVATVGLGRKYTFLMSLTIGYLLEIMLPMLIADLVYAQYHQRRRRGVIHSILDQ